MHKRLLGKTASVMSKGAELLQTTLVHKSEPFNHSHLVTVAYLIRDGHIAVKVDPGLFSAKRAEALYLPYEVNRADIVPGESEEWLPGNTLYLPASPGEENHWIPRLVHEAVHISSDIRGIPERIWHNEQLAYFVDAFITARLDRQGTKRLVGPNNYLLIGCLASDVFDRDPSIGAIRSEEFNKPIRFDYTSDGGVKGKANAYAVLNNLVRRAYPHGKRRAVTPFDGTNSFNPATLPASVREVYKLGAMAWPLVLDKAIQAGKRNTDELTDIVFHLHHPERYGRPLAPDEGALIREWRGFRAMVSPRVA
jgi:hypothetical protein